METFTVKNVPTQFFGNKDGLLRECAACQSFYTTRNDSMVIVMDACDRGLF